MLSVELIRLNELNAHMYGMCGYKNIKQEGYSRKLEWLKSRFSEGMVYRILNSADDGPVGGIEYIPGENAWRPVEAEGYMFIHCIYIMSKNFQNQGYGALMVNACLDDARRENRLGAAVVARKGTWMPKQDLFLKMGFSVVDTLKPDFSLLALKFRSESPNPRFPPDLLQRPAAFGAGLTIITSCQCPYTEKSVREICEMAEAEYGITPVVKELKSSGEARRGPSVFGVYGIIYNGKLVAEHPVSCTRFKNIMTKLIKSDKKL